jgi:crossover junction endodeoxyribonuclease RuvC
MFEMRVLGVDPGLARLGVAVVSGSGRSPVLQWAGTLRTDAGVSEAERLSVLAAGVRRAIADHRPTTMAVERVAWNRNEVSALSVARATGAVMVVAAEAGLAVEEYGPNEVKMAVAGAGNAGKDQVRRALSLVHRLEGIPTDPDAGDAVAVALTHLLGAKMKSLARSGRR